MAIDVTKTISDNLDPQRRYAVRVRAVNSFGLPSPWSDTYTFTTNDDSGNPAIPADVDLSAGIRTLVLLWSPATDTDFDHYEIHINPGVGEFTPTAANMVSRIRQSSFEIINKYWTGTAWADLTPGSTYSVKMRSVDVAGNHSDYTGSVSATTGYVTNSDIQAGTITADRILAGSITTAQLSALTFNVGKYMRSFNFDGSFDANGLITSFGTAGWAMDGNGTAVFTSGIFRGSLEIGSNRRIIVDASADGQIRFDNQTPLLEDPIISSKSVDNYETLFLQGPRKIGSSFNNQLILKTDKSTGEPEITATTWQDATPGRLYKAGKLSVTTEKVEMSYESEGDTANFKIYKNPAALTPSIYIASGVTNPKYGYIKLEENTTDGALGEIKVFQNSTAATPSFGSITFKDQSTQGGTLQIFNRGRPNNDSFSELLMTTDTNLNAEQTIRARRGLYETKMRLGWSTLTTPRMTMTVDDPVNRNKIVLDATVDNLSPVITLATTKSGTTTTGCLLPLIGSTFGSVITTQNFMQSGFVTGTTDGSSDLTITFPTVFPNASWSIVVTPFSNTVLNAQAHTNSASSFKIRFWNAAGSPQPSTSVSACWFAFGN